MSAPRTLLRSLSGHTRVTGAIIALLLATSSASSFAAASKMDPLVRVAAARLRAGVSLEEMRAERNAVNQQGDLDVFIRGTVSRGQLEALGVKVRTEVNGIFTAYIPPSALEAVANLPTVVSIRGSAPAEPTLNASIPAIGANVVRGAGPAFSGTNGAGILVGDVDSGVDFDHGDFKNAAGLTRFVNIWDQTVAGAPPAGYGIGTEWSPAQINGGSCTETDLSGHGSHVLGIIGGDGSQTGGSVPAFTYAGVAPQADLLMVKTTFSTTDVLDGVSYILGRGSALGKNTVVQPFARQPVRPA